MPETKCRFCGDEAAMTMTPGGDLMRESMTSDRVAVCSEHVEVIL